MSPVDFASRQQVEGFAELISASGKHPFAPRAESPLGPDFRGPAQAYWTREWWLPPDGTEADVVWRTAPAPLAVDTTFTFIGDSANLPENLYPTNQARLYVNGEHVLTFDLGLRERRVWQEGDFALEFEPRQIYTTVDGRHRQFQTGGCCGFYRLAVPGRVLTAGQPVELRVVLEPPRSDAIHWFAVRRRTDVLDITPQTNAEQIAQLQAELIHLKRIVGNLARRSYAELLRERLPTEEVLIYHNGRAHVHPPDVFLLQNGDLLVAFREASEHLSNDGKIVMVRSRDGGKTWDERQVLREHPHTDERDVSITQLRDGTVLVNNWPNPFYDRAGRYWARAMADYAGKPGGLYFGRSTDNGYTWAWTEQPLDPTPFAFLAASERIVELESGRLILPVYFSRGDVLRHYGCGVYASDDKGETWRHLATVADVPGVRLSEPALTLTRSGRLIMMMRNERGPGEPYYQANSDDGGETWTEARPSPIPGYRNPASLVTLTDGTVLCVHGSREDPSGIYVVASYDEGETWDMANRRVVRDDFPNMDCCYPSTVQMHDGRVLTVYYFNMFHRFFIAGSFFRWERP